MSATVKQQPNLTLISYETEQKAGGTPAPQSSVFVPGSTLPRRRVIKCYPLGGTPPSQARPREYPLEWISPKADKLAQMFALGCEPGMCAVAGDVRRKSSMVGSIAIVCVPIYDRGEDGSRVESFARLDAIISLAVEKGALAWAKEPGTGADGPKLKKLLAREWGDVPVDLHIATEETFGNALVWWTGSGGWNHLMVTKRAQGGLMPDNMRYVGARLRRVERKIGQVVGIESPVVCRTEEEMFAAMGLPYVRPEDRKEKTAMEMVRAIRNRVI